MVKFKDFPRIFSVFQVLFKANLFFKDFSRQNLYIQVLFKPVRTLNANENGDDEITDAEHDSNTTGDDNTCNRHDGFYDNIDIEYDLKQNIQKQQY